MKKINILIVLILFIFSVNLSFACDLVREKNDYLYSEAYFDYLIECASIEHQEEIERKKQQEKEALKEAEKSAKHTEKAKNEILLKDSEISLIDNVVLINEENEDSVEGFKLRIQNSIEAPKFSETFKKEDSKIIIPVAKKFSFIYDTSTSRNKYSSTDYKIMAGGELQPFKIFKIAGGLETNYRDLDQNPASRKLYVIPEFKITDRINLLLPNKYNIHSGAMDHDIGLNVSPFKSKSMDFGVYSGVTRSAQGKTTQSVNFTTNFYLF